MKRILPFVIVGISSMDRGRADFRVGSGRRVGAIANSSLRQQVRRASLGRRVGIHVCIRQRRQRFRGHFGRNED